MLRKNRPLFLLLISDFIGLLVIGAGIVEGSWDARIAIVYVAMGLGILQIPILASGILRAAKSRDGWMLFFFLAHGGWSWLLVHILDWHDMHWVLFGVRAK